MIVFRLSLRRSTAVVTECVEGSLTPESYVHCQIDKELFWGPRAAAD